MVDQKRLMQWVIFIIGRFSEFPMLVVDPKLAPMAKFSHKFLSAEYLP